MELLRVKDLRFLDYGPVEFSLPQGQVLGVSGASGSGKSLLLKSLADLIDSAGEVYLQNENRWEISPPQWRSRVMLVPVESQWWFETVGEHFPEASAPVWRDLGFDDDVLKKLVIELSSGEKQRLGLARVLCRCPDVLLLDEPTANLDPENTERVESCIHTFLSSGTRAAVWVSHDADQLERIVDVLAKMTDKQLKLEVSA